MARTPLRKSLSVRSQAVGLEGARRVLKGLGPVFASNLGGWVARSVGPLLSVSRIADANLQRALPDMESEARIRTIRGVWDNLGRNCAEFPHLENFKRTDSGPGWELAGGEHLDELRRTGGQALFFSGHFGNWEMVLPIASQLDMTVSGFYRAASNRGVNDFIQGLRQKALGDNVFMFAKGAPGARAALLHLARGGRLGLLVDQKMNDGIAVPFFGQAAMTAPALAQFALRFQVPIMPVHVVRLGPARFRMVCDPPLTVALTGVKDADVYALTLAMNAVLEGWIREDPASWLWLHRRWPKHAAAGAAL